MQQRNLAFLMKRLGDGPHWRVAAACQFAEPDLFFPISASDRNSNQVDAAKAVCASCLVRRECLEFAVGTQQMHGVWGGLTEEERYRVIAADRHRHGRQPGRAGLVADGVSRGAQARAAGGSRWRGGQTG